MAKSYAKYICQQCGYETAGWLGKCPECGSWNSFVETLVSRGYTGKENNSKTSLTKPVSLSSISSKATLRVSTKIPELDRVLGGGLVSGQVVLIAGEPGIGKSTLLLQVADKLEDGTKTGSVVLYVSGEESANQIAIRAKRLDINNKAIQLLEETDMDNVIDFAAQITSEGKPPRAIVIDSIQTMATTDLSGMAGSVGQVRECAFRLVKLAKSTGIPVFVVGHVTKEGTVAGPAVLMHIVDTVLWFEGDKTLTTRVLRAVKNRFGPTDEVGIFIMEDKGLVSESDPEKIFLSQSKKNMSGSVITSVLEGTRPILVEIQSLVVSTKLPIPRRIGQGVDSKKLELLLAVLTRRCNLPLYEYDCFLNVAGGISIRNDPSTDLAICLSVASSFFDRPLEARSVALGEVGLLGDIREVIAQEKRIKEAKRLGYRNVITNKEANYLGNAIKKYLR
jgi:DNA repair protein RadA/Sms